MLEPHTTAINASSLPLPSSNEVHIWCISISDIIEQIPRFRSTLSAEELKRANRYHFEKDRQCYIIARGMLRQLIAMYSNVHAQQINFEYNPHGKPRLAMVEDGEKKLNFNLSHSGNLVVFAFSLNTSVGIDVEQIRENIEYMEIASHIFTAGEYTTLRTLPHRQKRDAFFRCWTRKEAYIKAHGMGLSMPLKEFDVKLDGAEQPILLASQHHRNAILNWSIHNINLASGYAAALALAQPSCTIKYCEWRHNQT